MAKGNNNLLVGVGVVILLAVAFLIGRFTNTSTNAIAASTTVAQTTTLQSTVPSSTTTILNTTGAQNNTVVQILYHNKTIQLSAPTYNPNYNRVTGCYWIDGYENFSFYAPYSGYIIFNETNNGIPTNFTSPYFDAVFSTEKPRYVLASPYNGSYWCSGETVQSNIAPYTVIAPFNNQTMIIPVRNGTNYFYLENGNANQEFGINPFPINVTFSMKYYGFKGTNYMPAPSFNVNKTVIIDWGRYS